MDPVDARIDQLHARNAGAARLAELSSLAVRLEPHLLRALRRRFLPSSDPSAELDLWHSTLVQSRGANAAMLDVDVQARLRDVLANDPQRHAAYELTLQCFGDHPALQRFELGLNALPVLDAEVSEDAIERHFEPLLSALREGGEAARRVAVWTVQAAPRWHPRVRSTAAAWASTIAASAILDGRRVISDALPKGLNPVKLAQGLPPSLAATRKVGVALTRRKLRFLPPEKSGAATIDGPAMSPALMLLEVEGQPARVIDAQPGAEFDLPGVDRVTLRGLLGDAWRIELPPRVGKESKELDATPETFRARIDARYYDPETLTLEVQTTSRPPRHVQLTMADPVAPMRVGSVGGTFGWPGEAWERLGRDTVDALAFLERAEVVEVATDDRSATLPWENMPIVGPRVLRVPPALPVENVATRLRSIPREALVITPSSRSSGKSDPGWTSEGERLARSIQDQTSASVRHLDQPDARAVMSALFERPLALLHIAGDGLVRANETSFGLPLPDGQVLTAAEIEQARRAPEMVFLDVDLSAISPMEEGASGVLISAFLRRGTRIAVATVKGLHPGQRTEFIGLLYRRLLAGETLLASVLHARAETAVRWPKVRPQDYFQIWGDPDAKLSIARVPRGLDRKMAAIESSVLTIETLGSTGRPCTGAWVGNGLIATVRAPFGGVPFIAGTNAQGTMQFATGADPTSIADSAEAEAHDDDLLIASQVAGATGPIMQLAVQPLSGTRVSGRIVVALDGSPTEIDVDVTRDDSQRLLQVQHARDDGSFPMEVPGAPVTVDGQCVGIVIARDTARSNIVSAVDVAHIRQAVRGAWNRRVRELLADHAGWLESGDQQGRRLSMPGVVLTGIDLAGARLDRADLRSIRLEEAVLTGASLNGADLRRAKLARANLGGATLRGADLARAQLVEVDARRADFSGADLRKADLTRANLSGAVFEKVRLEGASLQDADLRGARLSGTSLDGIVGMPLTDVPEDTSAVARTALRVYVASTHADLGAERGVVRRAVATLGHEVIAAEDYPATDSTPMQHAARQVADCDVFVCVVARRYGYIPPGADGNPRGLSSVELEYEEARRLGKPILVFLLHERGEWPTSQTDAQTGDGQRGTLVDRFRQRLKREQVVSYFNGPDDLAAAVGKAIARISARGMGEKRGAEAEIEAENAAAAGEVNASGRAEVFLSSVAVDEELIAALTSALSETGLRVWWDRNELRVGGEWEARTMEAIQRAAAAVVVWTGRSQGSKSQALEVTAIVARGIPLLVIREPGLTLPATLETYSVVDLDPRLKAPDAALLRTEIGRLQSALAR